MNNKIIASLDTTDENKISFLIDNLKNKLEWFKIGPIPFFRFGHSIIERIKMNGFKVFLDMKLHDIPHTVSESVKIASDMGIDMMTIHIAGGTNMLSEINKIPNKPIIIGVSLLSSVNINDISYMFDTKYSNDTDLVLNLIKKGMESGITHFVASGALIRRIKEIYPTVKLIVPGIRFTPSVEKEHKRVLTPKEAFMMGADYIVMGRPLLQLENISKLNDI